MQNRTFGTNMVSHMLHLGEIFTDRLCCTVMVLSFRTDRTGLCKQRSSLIRFYTVCHSVCITLWKSLVQPCSNFSVMTTIFSGVQIFTSCTVILILHHLFTSFMHLYTHFNLYKFLMGFKISQGLSSI